MGQVDKKVNTGILQCSQMRAPEAEEVFIANAALCVNRNRALAAATERYRKAFYDAVYSRESYQTSGCENCRGGFPANPQD